MENLLHCLPRMRGLGFEAKRFKPYVLDVAADVDALSKSEQLDEAQLKKAVFKLQQLLQLLATFK